MSLLNDIARFLNVDDRHLQPARNTQVQRRGNPQIFQGGRGMQGGAAMPDAEYAGGPESAGSTGFVLQGGGQSRGPLAQSSSPAQRNFPGRTNYGVPEDNMIDTPRGYVTSAQYDEIRRRPFRMYEDQSFQGNPGIGKAFHPGFTFYEDNSFSPPRPVVPQPPSLNDFLNRYR